MLKWIFDAYYDPSGSVTAIRVFQYITFRATVSAAMGFVLSLYWMPRVIRWCRESHFQAASKEDVPFHSQKAGTPILGGAVVVLATLAATLVCGNLANTFVQMLGLVLVGIGAVGFLDDYLKSFRSEVGLFGRYKLLFQFVVAAVIVGWIYHTSIEYRLLWKSAAIQSGFQTQIGIPFFKNIFIDLGPWYIPLAIIVIVGASNAVNLTDGLDGLAGGLSIFSIGAYAVLAYLSGHFFFSRYLQVINVVGAGEITVVLAGMLGGLMGFLWHNAPPAEIFLGDTGALTIGAILGTVAILIKQELLLVLAGSMFVAETVSVLIQTVVYRWNKRTHGKDYANAHKVFRMSPLHHHFELCGWAESKIVIRFWILGIVSVLATMASLKLR